MKKTLLLLCALMVSIGIAWGADNLALTATPSTENGTHAGDIANVVKDDNTTWQAKGQDDSGNQVNAEIVLAWENEQTFTTFEIIQSGDRYSTGYTLYSSTDGSTWTKIDDYTISSLDQTQKITSTTTKYLKFESTAVNVADAYGITVKQLCVYNIDYSNIVLTSAKPSSVFVAQNGTVTLSAYDADGNVIGDEVTYSVTSGNGTISGSTYTADGNTGAITITANYNSKDVTTTVYVLSDSDAPTAPTASSVADPIYSNSNTEHNSTVNIITAYDGGATKGTEITLNGQVVMPFTSVATIFLLNSAACAGDVNTNWSDVEKGHDKLKFSIFSDKAYTGTFTTGSISETVTLKAYEWVDVTVDVSASTSSVNNKLQFNSSQIDGLPSILIANIYYTSAVEDKDAPVWDETTPIEASEITTNSVKLTLKATDASAIKYTIAEKDNKIASKEVNAESGTTEYTVTGLTESTEYTFNVTVADKFGNTNGTTKNVTITTLAKAKPTTAATAPTLAPSKVYNIYSDAYANGKSFADVITDWDAFTTKKEAYDIDGDNMLHLTNAGGISFNVLTIGDLSTDSRAYTKIHMDVFPVENVNLSSFKFGTQGTPETTITISETLTAGQWNGVDLNVADAAAVANLTNVNFATIKFGDSSDAELYVDNIYFYNEPTEAEKTTLTIGTADETTGVAALTGTLSSTTASTFTTEATKDILAFDLSGLSITDDVELTAGYNNAVFIVSAGQKAKLGDTKNLIVKNANADNYTGEITLTDNNNANLFATTLNIVNSDVTYTRASIADDKYVTVALPFTAAVPDGFSAYATTENEAASDNTLTFNKVTGNLEAGKPYIVHNISGGSKDFVAKATETNLGWMAGTSGATQAVLSAEKNVNGYYVLSNGEFKKAGTNAKVGGFRGYLNISASAPAFTIIFDEGDGTTTIATINAEGEVRASEAYNLNGQRVVNPTKGLYIVNGKKLVIK